MNVKHFSSLLFFCISIFQIQAQNCQEALSFFQDQQFKQAYEAYKKCVKDNPKDSMLVYMQGLTLVRLEQYKDAIPVLEKAVELNYFPLAAAQFNIAKCNANLDQKKEALFNLKAANENGFNQFQLLESDDFKLLLASKDYAESFKTIQQETKYNAYPCLQDEGNRKFDFWLGEWDVYAGGQKIATSDITRAKGGCAVQEDYKTFGLYAGQSINFYNPISKKWEQYWVGSSGDRTEYIETDHYDANLQFLGERKLSNGQISHSKMTFTYNKEEDTVTQSFEDSTDSGQTWTLGFVGVYKRRKEE